MTIDEARKILRSNGLKPEGTTWGEYLKAVKLGSEALKRIKECGRPARCGLLERLPGETAPEKG